MEMHFRQGRHIGLSLATAVMTSWYKQSHTTQECREFMKYAE